MAEGMEAVIREHLHGRGALVKVSVSHGGDVSHGHRRKRTGLQKDSAHGGCLEGRYTCRTVAKGQR